MLYYVIFFQFRAQESKRRNQRLLLLTLRLRLQSEDEGVLIRSLNNYRAMTKCYKSTGWWANENYQSSSKSNSGIRILVLVHLLCANCSVQDPKRLRSVARLSSDIASRRLLYWIQLNRAYCFQMGCDMVQLSVAIFNTQDGDQLERYNQCANCIRGFTFSGTPSEPLGYRPHFSGYSQWSTSSEIKPKKNGRNTIARSIIDMLWSRSIRRESSWLEESRLFWVWRLD